MSLVNRDCHRANDNVQVTANEREEEEEEEQVGEKNYEKSTMQIRKLLDNSRTDEKSAASEENLEEIKLNEKRREVARSLGCSDVEDASNGANDEGVPIEIFEKLPLQISQKNEASEGSPSKEDYQEKSTRKYVRKKRTLMLVDHMLALTVVGPCVVSFWRGVWTLMDLNSDAFPAWLCLTCGTGTHFLFVFYKDRLRKSYLDSLKEKNCVKQFLHLALRTLCVYVFGVACNSQWRGAWIIITHYLQMGIWLNLTLLCIFLAALIVLRCVRNLLAPPMTVIVDRPCSMFQVPTRYQTNTRDWSLYLLDCAFSVGVVGTLVVFVWRGVWILLDLYLFPGDREYSAVGSLVIGYVTVAMTFCLQPLMCYACARLQGLARLIAADAFLLLSFLGTVNVWRGIWNALDLWLLPETPVLSCWITHVGSFVLLVLLNCSNSILVRGVYIDGVEDEGKCVVFPCHYLRLFFKMEREKKEARRRNLLVASKDLARRTEGIAKDGATVSFLANSTHPANAAEPLV